MRLLGLEPKTYGLKVRPALAATNDSATTSGDRTFVLADCLAFLATKSPDLSLVVERWESLPGPIRAGIVAIVRAGTAD